MSTCGRRRRCLLEAPFSPRERSRLPADGCPDGGPWHTGPPVTSLSGRLPVDDLAGGDSPMNAAYPTNPESGAPARSTQDQLAGFAVVLTSDRRSGELV